MHRYNHNAPTRHIKSATLHIANVASIFITPAYSPSQCSCNDYKLQVIPAFGLPVPVLELIIPQLELSNVLADLPNLHIHPQTPAILWNMPYKVVNNPVIMQQVQNAVSTLAEQSGTKVSKVKFEIMIL